MRIAPLVAPDLVDGAPMRHDGEVAAQRAAAEVDPGGQLPQVGEDVLRDLAGQLLVPGHAAGQPEHEVGVQVVDGGERILVAGADARQQQLVG